MNQDRVRHELQFIIDSASRMNKNFDEMLAQPGLHPNTVKIVGALKEYFGPLKDHLQVVSEGVLENFTRCNLENGRLRELLEKQCECGALDPEAQCEGCTYLEQLEEREKWLK